MPAQIIVTSLPYITLAYTGKHEQIFKQKANDDKIIGTINILSILYILITQKSLSKSNE